MNSRLAKFVVVAAIFSFATRAFAETSSIFLAWDANPESDIAGYKVYWGTSSGVYDQFNDVSQTTASVSDLTVGVRYYFAVTAYNEAGLESGYSEEVSAIVPPNRLRSLQAQLRRLNTCSTFPPESACAVATT